MCISNSNLALTLRYITTRNPYIWPSQGIHKNVNSRSETFFGGCFWSFPPQLKSQLSDKRKMSNFI